MKDEILKILKRENRAYSLRNLSDLLGLTTEQETKRLQEELDKMEQNLEVYCNRKGNYTTFNNTHLKVGTISVNRKGYGFVDIDGDVDVFIKPFNMNYAIHGDKVIVEIIAQEGEKLEGRIVKTINREFKEMVGIFYYKAGNAYVGLDDDKIKINIKIDPKKTMGAMNGHKVLVRIKKQIEKNDYLGEVVRILGHKNDPGVDILSIVAKYEINDTFNDDVMREADSLPLSVEKEKYKNRRDLTQEEIFTIDGDDTKDIDDAISLKILKNGNYELGVHIADVSYYVKENNPIDKEAYDRGTSVYLADRVIPMLPHKLSNGICSLNPNEERLAISCVMEIDKNGKTVNYEIFESIIKSRKQMTYKNVNKILEKNIVEKGYEPFVDTLKKMHELAKILQKMKEKRGYIDFDILEPKIIVDDKGKAIDVQLKDRGEGEKLIEDFMIAANETVATHIYFMDLPFVYRIHAEPNEEKIASFLKFISVLGYKVRGKVKNITPKTMQNILYQLKDVEEYNILSTFLLRTMAKAVYDKNNIGHFGLASKYYTHFTSPIRRYPDLTVHRLLRKYLFEKDLDIQTLKAIEEKLGPLTEHASEKERDSIECEREVTDMKKAEYMMDHIGEYYDGIVSSVMNFGMFISLPNSVEGLVRLDDLDDDYYIFDEETFSLRGENNKRGYRLGDKVKVMVKSANKLSKTVDFVIKKEK